MPLIEAQYASEDGHRTARVFRNAFGRWRVVFWEWRPSTETQHGNGYRSLAVAQHAAEAWAGDREG